MPAVRSAAVLVLAWVLTLGSPGAGAPQPLPLATFYGLANPNGAAAQASLERIGKSWQ